MGDLFPLVRAQRPVGTFLVFAAMALIVVAVIWFHRPAAQIRRLLPLLVVAPLPFLFYAVASNMSLIHNWLMYRILSITIFSVIYFALASTDFKKLRERFRGRDRVQPAPGAESSPEEATA